MFFELMLFAAALICLFLTVCSGAVLYRRRKVISVWRRARSLYKERVSLYASALGILRLTYAEDSKTVTAFTEAVDKAKYAAEPQDIVAAKKKMTEEFARVCALVKKYPLLREKDAFIKIRSGLDKNEEQTAFAIQFYNEEVRRFNRALSEMPLKVIAVVFGIKRMKEL